VDLGGATATNLLVNGDFETAIVDPWHTWNNTGCASSISRQSGNAAVGSACARCDISQTTGTDWHIEFAQYNRSLVQGVNYDLTFWARSGQPRYLSVGSQKGSPDWRNYGLSQRLAITTNWQQYTATFSANETVSDARVQFFLGETTGTVWLDDVRADAAPAGRVPPRFQPGSGPAQRHPPGEGCQRWLGPPAFDGCASPDV